MRRPEGFFEVSKSPVCDANSNVIRFATFSQDTPDRSPQGPVQTLTHADPQGPFLQEVQNDRQE
jgi:hypothetical protein